VPTPRQERQAIFLGATEPTRCPTGKESAAGVTSVSQGGLAVSISSVRARSRRLMLAKLTIELAEKGEFTAASLGDRVLKKMRPKVAAELETEAGSNAPIGRATVVTE
jgi:hypothetical protein